MKQILFVAACLTFLLACRSSSATVLVVQSDEKVHSLIEALRIQLRDELWVIAAASEEPPPSLARRTAEDNPAVQLAVWVTLSEAGDYVLHVARRSANFEPGEAIDLSAGANAADERALAIQLAEIYREEKVARARPAPAPAAPEPALPPPRAVRAASPAAPAKFAVGLGSELRYELDALGPSYGPRISLTRSLNDARTAAIFAGARFVLPATAETSDRWVRVWELTGFAGARVGFPVGPLVVGPAASLLGRRLSAEAGTSEGRSGAETIWNFGGSMRLVCLWPMTPSATLQIELGVDVLPRPPELLVSGQTLVSGGYLEPVIALELGFDL